MGRKQGILLVVCERSGELSCAERGWRAMPAVKSPFPKTKAAQMMDECPPENGAYYCQVNEAEEPCCDQCWSHYLLELYNAGIVEP